ncbi:hypothetical protein HWQ46_21990 [Shewanella sp. D64]|uniref:hypothetical protein n=1 Tax=unclassified Shewanella TaxID=196818 RepID=UPI0022BA275F|nr:MULTISPECIES: hypothetical protein [unclassified Shewanella]MEC4728211.1 hypothetical protein [Shewanella sp. D64]MEC4740008.1 hypothetical protein [Shewanella sp. E94]WBJ94364.1 hypothetical protein HWQ47_21225 [Shewanella sp. MTB7]
MNRKLLWGINTFVLIILIVSVTISYRHLNPSQTLMMSCSSELFDRNEPGENVSRHYLLVDVFAKGKLAQLNYRYFNHDGSSAGNIRMKGSVLDVSLDAQKYLFSVKTKEEFGFDSEVKPPEHMRYLSYVSSFNLDNKGMHNLSVEMLDFNEQHDYAVVLFQPSNTVCGCRLVQ